MATGSESESAALPDSGPPPSAIMQPVCRYRERAGADAQERASLRFCSTAGAVLGYDP